MPKLGGLHHLYGGSLSKPTSGDPNKAFNDSTFAEV
jgi:hypothetical protein